MKPMIRLANCALHRRGSSLIELLVVVAIAVALPSFDLPALASLRGSGQINQTVAELSGLLEQARQYAIAQNTYAWAAFYPTTNTRPAHASFRWWCWLPKTEPIPARGALTT